MQLCVNASPLSAIELLGSSKFPLHQLLTRFYKPSHTQRCGQLPWHLLPHGVPPCTWSRRTHTCSKLLLLAFCVCFCVLSLDFKQLPFLRRNHFHTDVCSCTSPPFLQGFSVFRTELDLAVIRAHVHSLRDYGHLCIIKAQQDSDVLRRRCANYPFIHFGGWYVF